MNLNKPYGKISYVLRKARNRIILSITLRNVTAGLCTALAAGIILELLSRLIPIYRVYVLWGYAGAGIFLLSLLSVFLFLPKKKAVARLLDSFGLQERIITSLELEKEDSEYKELLLEDTVSKLDTVNYREKIKLLPDKKLLAAVIFLTLAFGATVLLPQPLLEEARQAHELNAYKKEQKKKVEKAEKEVEKNTGLTQVQKKDLLDKLEALKQELKKSQDTRAADKALEKLAKKLEQKIDKTKEADLKNLAEKLAGNKTAQALADALKSEKKEEIGKEFENLKNKLKSMSAAEKNDLKAALSKAADSLGDSELKDSLNGLGGALNSGDENAVNKSVDKLNGAVNDSLSQKNMNNALAQAQNDLQPNAVNAQNQGQNSGQGQGAAQGQGQGAGQGKGAGGSSAGSGTGNGDGGVTPYGQGGIANKAPSAGQEKEYEKVFTPSRLGGQGETSVITGKGNNNGKSETTITNNADASLGELMPYNQVVGQYSERAMESMDNSSIPGGMEDIIKNYFASLQD
ncbi:hypothetical protein [Ruminiclostridium cellobioparum]|uniref:hypothetical protein n=1 Tax=Ruminiclostridium cellobioparum TaxID=29355 RepID=UPI0028B11563|nr:hypothetical protein [Ruminiclostridium cellobioparum]